MFDNTDDVDDFRVGLFYGVGMGIGLAIGVKIGEWLMK